MNAKFEYVKMTTEHAMNLPSEVVYTEGEFVISKTYIPYTYTEAKVCYFVDFKDECACGSYATIELAKERIRNLKNGVSE